MTDEDVIDISVDDDIDPDDISDPDDDIDVEERDIPDDDSENMPDFE